MLSTTCTYISRELGPIFAPAATEDGLAATHWGRRVIQVYSAAANQKWEGDLAKRLNEMRRNFVARSKGATMAADRRSRMRPRACAHHGFINSHSDQATSDKRFTKVPVIQLTRDKAQPLAFAQPPHNYCKKTFQHTHGIDMTDEQTVHETLRQAHQKST